MRPGPRSGSSWPRGRRPSARRWPSRAASARCSRCPGRHEDLRGPGCRGPLAGPPTRAPWLRSATPCTRRASSPCAASSTSPWPTCSTSRPRLVAVCADVRDPGNAGTVIRCADAAGAGGVVLTGDSVDVYNGKTVRASVGSRLPPPRRGRARRGGHRRGAARGGADRPRRRRRRRDRPRRGRRLRPAARTARRGCSATRPGASPPSSPPWPTTGSGSRSTAAPSALNLATAAAVCLYASARAQRHS